MSKSIGSKSFHYPNLKLISNSPDTIAKKDNSGKIVDNSLGATKNITTIAEKISSIAEAKPERISTKIFRSIKNIAINPLVKGLRKIARPVEWFVNGYNVGKAARKDWNAGKGDYSNTKKQALKVTVDVGGGLAIGAATTGLTAAALGIASTAALPVAAGAAAIIGFGLLVDKIFE